MICPFCKEEIADGAIKCKHCASILNFPQPDELPQNDMKSIEDNDYNQKLRAMFEKKNYRVILGLPIFTNFRDQLRACWWLGLPYAPLNVAAYLFRGMFKKAVVLAGLYALVIAMAKMGLIGIAFLGILVLALYVVIAMRHDEYRKSICNETDFWW
jgi:hypothetical protein